MQLVTQWFVVLVIPTILLVDFLFWKFFGEATTITFVVRSWNEKSAWPEVIYLVIALLAYLHLYRKTF